MKTAPYPSSGKMTDPMQDEMPPPSRSLPAGQELEGLRYRLADEAIAELTIQAREMRAQAERMFRMLALDAGVTLPPSSFGESRAFRPSRLLAKLKSLVRRVLLAMRRWPAASATEAGASGVPPMPPGCHESPCFVAESAATGRALRVGLAADPECDDSRIEDFLLLAQRFQSDNSVRFVVSSRLGEHHRKLSRWLQLDNVEFLYDLDGSMQSTPLDLCCATAEAPLGESSRELAQSASFVVATSESGISDLDSAAPRVGDIDAFEAAVAVALTSLRRPASEGVAS